MAKEITWLRSGTCDEGDTSEAAARLAGYAGMFLVSKVVTDPDVLGALASRIGAGEVLTHVSDDLFPELT